MGEQFPNLFLIEHPTNALSRVPSNKNLSFIACLQTYAVFRYDHVKIKFRCGNKPAL